MSLVLLVDDDRLVRLVAAEFLSEAGHSVIEADRGAAAMDVLRSVPVDVLVTDIRMPGELNGWEVAEAARQLRPDLPVVYTSGFSSTPIRAVDGAAYLAKPFPMAALQDAVSAAVLSKCWQAEVCV